MSDSESDWVSEESNKSVRSENKSMLHFDPLDNDDVIVPPLAPLIDLGELRHWILYRALICELVAALLFQYITVATVVGYKVQTSADQCDGVGVLGIAWASGGMMFVLVYCNTRISDELTELAKIYGDEDCKIIEHYPVTRAHEHKLPIVRGSGSLPTVDE